MRGTKAALIVVALAALARAQEPEDMAGKKLPAHPLQGAAAGDWCVLTGTAQNESASFFSKVMRVEGTTAELRRRQRNVPSLDDETKLLVSTGEAPSLGQFVSKRRGIFRDLVVADETRTVGEKAFATKKVSFVWDKGEEKCEMTLWLSSEVKGSGIVAWSLVRTVDNEPPVTTKLEVAGFGTAEKTLFGKSALELVDQRTLADPLSWKPVPLNPWTEAKADDWATYRSSLTWGETERTTLECRIKAADQERVTVVTRDCGAGGRGDTVELSRALAPLPVEILTCLHLSRDDSGPHLADFSTEAEKKTVGGREFACTRVHFKMQATLDFEWTLWFSAEVKGCGVVAAEFKEAGEARAGIAGTVELAGFGNGDTAAWGKRVDELPQKTEKEKPQKK
jgi:hypothetical protein